MCDLGVAAIDRRSMMVLLLVVSASVAAQTAQAQKAEGLKPWWVGLQMGYAVSVHPGSAD